MPGEDGLMPCDASDTAGTDLSGCRGGREKIKQEAKEPVTMRTKQFKAESKKLLDMMINSIYTHKEIFLRELISSRRKISLWV